MNENHLFTTEYKKLLEKKHETGTAKQKFRAWGGAVVNDIQYVMSFIHKYKINSVLDYGSGSGHFKQWLDENGRDDIEVLEYEPGREDKRENNHPRQAVICVDVLEHVEPELIDNVLQDIERCMLEFGCLIPSTIPAIQKLADGRNAHLIVESVEWWESKISQYFRIHSIIRQKGISPVFIVKKKS